MLSGAAKTSNNKMQPSCRWAAHTLESQSRQPADFDRYAAKAIMKQLFTTACLIAFAGCGATERDIDTSVSVADGWTVTIDTFRSTPDTSLLTVSIEATRPCQLVTSEPHSGVNRTVLFVPDANGRHSAIFSWRKEFSKQDNGNTHLKTWSFHKSAGIESESGPSHVNVGPPEDLPTIDHFQRVVRPASTKRPFGESVVIATNNDGKETTVTVLSDLTIPESKTD